MRARLGRLGPVALAAAAALFSSAPAFASHSYPATYTGSVAGGGSVEFDVSADGSAITRFKISEVPTECGTVSTELTGSVPIVDHAFGHTTPPVMFGGSFPATQAAQGTVQYRQVFPSCTSAPRSWNATTPVAPPDTTAPVITLSGRTKQRAGRTISVAVTSDETGSAKATGTVIVPRTGRTAARFALRSAAAQLAPNVAARLALAIPRSARTAIGKALRNGKRVRAIVKVTVRDAAGNSATQKRTIRLRRP